MSKKLSAQYILKMVCIYILLQPLFDVLSFLSIRGYIPFGISTYVKPIFVFGLGLYIFISNSSIRKKWFVYFLSYGIFCLVHFFLLYELMIPLPTIAHELRFLMNIGYMLVLFMIFWYLYNEISDRQYYYDILKKTLIITMYLYMSIIVISIITGSSARTYEYADPLKKGWKGWLDSGQIFGHALSLSLPILVVSILNSKRNLFIKLILLLMPIFVMINLGTKVPFMMSIIVLIIFVIVELILKFLHREKKLQISSIVIPILLIIMVLACYTKVPVYTNIKINQDMLNTSLNAFDGKDIDGKTNVIDLKKLSAKYKNNKRLHDYYIWNLESSKSLDKMYKTGKIHPADNRKRQFYYSYKKFSLADIEYKLFGIGYLNQTSELSLESDVWMSLFCFGIVGFILMLIFPLIEFIKATFYILSNFKKIDAPTFMLYACLGSFFFISTFAGYTFIYTNFSIFLVIITMMLKLKIRIISKQSVMFISSTGGHLSELLQLKELFNEYPYYLITEKTKSTVKLKEKYKENIGYLIFGSKDHLFSYLFYFTGNCFKSFYYYMKVRPTVIVTTGTHTAVPICYIGKLFGSKIIFIETFANSKSKTLSGKLVYPIADIFIVQWEEMLKLYPKAIYGGWIY